MEEYTARLPILVVGLPGVPGYNAFFYLRRLFPGQVIGIVPPNAPQLFEKVPPLYFSPSLISADPEKIDQLTQVFDQFQVRTVVDASGWCALKPCELDPALGRRLNIDVGVNVMREAKRAGARLIRLSTDLVFDGTPYLRNGILVEGDYVEDWPVSPVTNYGRFIAESEVQILTEYSEAAILRIALPMGPSMNGHAGAIDWIESRFSKNRPATLYFDEVRSNLYVQDLNKVILAFINNNEKGLYHVGGPVPLSLFEIAQAINKLGNYPQELLMGCLRAAAGPMPPRAGNVVMNTDRVTRLLPKGILRPWPASPSHLPTDRDWHTKRESQFPNQAIAHYLYGDDMDSWDHPLNLMGFGST